MATTTRCSPAPARPPFWRLKSAQGKPHLARCASPRPPWLRSLRLRVLMDGCDAAVQAVDLWATGITLYMMLAGHVPFHAPTVPEIYEKIKVRLRHALCGTLAMKTRGFGVFFLRVCPRWC